jgi:hypothetical protein
MPGMSLLHPSLALNVIYATNSRVEFVLLRQTFFRGFIPRRRGRLAVTNEFSAELGGDLDQLLRRANQQLGAAGRRVARFISENRQVVLASSAAALGDRTGTSDATVVRTIQTLGFAGLGDLKRAILNSIGHVSTPADDMRRTLGDLEKKHRTCPRQRVADTLGWARRAEIGRMPGPDRRRRAPARPGKSNCRVRYRSLGRTGDLRIGSACAMRATRSDAQRHRLDACRSTAGSETRGFASYSCLRTPLQRSDRRFRRSERPGSCDRPRDRSKQHRAGTNGRRGDCNTTRASRTGLLARRNARRLGSPGAPSQRQSPTTP